MSSKGDFSCKKAPATWCAKAVVTNGEVENSSEWKFAPKRDENLPLLAIFSTVTLSVPNSFAMNLCMVSMPSTRPLVLFNSQSLPQFSYSTDQFKKYVVHIA